MTKDGTWTYTWEHGRELATMSNGSTTWTNTYNTDGLRTKRTDGSTTYSYVYNGSSLSQMTVGTHLLNFAYDASGAPMAVTYDGTTYYYVTNLQGDVIAILDGSGNAVVQYMYDAWGKLWETTGSMATTLGVHNPLRYRGYVYDSETQLYYLQSRYYNPAMGRFLCADGYASTGQGMIGYNMFAYCNNNCVNYVDSSGSLPMRGDIKNPNMMVYGSNNSRFSTVWIHVTEYSYNPTINSICKDIETDVESFWDSTSALINAENLTDFKDAAIGIWQNDIIQDVNGVNKVRNGSKQIGEGMTMIIVFPDPTWTDEIFGTARIVQGFANVVMGVGEILEWR